MDKSIKGEVVYFANKGKENSDEVAKIVATRLAKGDVSAVAVATTSGFSALTLAKAVSAGTRIYGVNFQNSTKLESGMREKAEALGVRFMPDEPTARYLKDIAGHSPDTLRCFGQGMKVAVEVIMQAVEVGHIENGETVIGVGGSSRGSDVAIVARAAGPDNLSEMWISEILAKPL